MVEISTVYGDCTQVRYSELIGYDPCTLKSELRDVTETLEHHDRISNLLKSESLVYIKFKGKYEIPDYNQRSTREEYNQCYKLLNLTTVLEEEVRYLILPG